VKLDDEFMHCVTSGAPYIQQYPIDSTNPIVRREVNARTIWDKLIHNAWQSAEPGVLFWSTIKKESVADCYTDFGFETVSTNPCGEIPLCPYDSCRLLAVNIYSYVENPFTELASFNFEKFKSHVEIAQRLMDDLIDMEVEKIDNILKKIESDPEPDYIKRVEHDLWTKIRKKTITGRRTGLGITGEGDMLAALNIRYGSETAIEFSTEVHKQMALAAYRSSVTLAKERGKFEIYNTTKEHQNPFIKRLREAAPELYQEMMLHGRRNIALLTIAPTGTVSLCTQTTSGIEPVFMITHIRRRKVNPNDENVKVMHTDGNGDAFEEYHVLHPKFTIWAEINGYSVTDLKNMSQEKLNQLIEKSPYYKSTAHDIDWVMKVKLQGSVQKWVDHSISVTVNIPEATPENIVSDIYRTAWESGCKGMTIYREGSRDSAPLQSQSGEECFEAIDAPLRPEKIEADVIRFKNEGEEWIAMVGLYEGKPYEIFTGKTDTFFLHPAVKKGWIVRVKEDKTQPARYDFIYKDNDNYGGMIEGLSRQFNKEYWNYAKLISGVLRQGMPLHNVVNLISKLRFDSDNIQTWKNGVTRALKKYITDGTKVKQSCPQCNQKSLVYKDGCVICLDCGHSKCE
jgi:ribonucleoside-diphosphate reductase alpha chain